MDQLKREVYESARDGMAITIYARLSNKSEKEIADVLTSERTENGQKTTPFIIAARNGHNKVVRILASNYKVDIEQTGTVKFDGYVIEGATALWCAAGAGHLEVVKTLIEMGADVNHSTFSNSTPLRAACFDGRLDIVRYLLQHKADLNIPNKYNNTCLMIASFKSHCDVVRFLLERGADPNTRAHCGATALHFAAERGNLDIVKELVKYKAETLKNYQGMTALHMAAESSKADIVEFFISQKDCDKVDRVEALELLGASYANDKDSYDLRKAYQYIWLAMQERHCACDQIVLQKAVKPAVEAYANRKECQTIKELEAIKENHDAIHMEALIIRERILGEDNAEIPHPIIFRGAVFADTARFDRCTALWFRAMDLRARNDRSITKDILRFAQVFSQMSHVGVEIEFKQSLEVFKLTLDELHKDKERVTGSPPGDIDLHREIYENNIHTALYLLAIMAKLKINKEEEFKLCQLVYAFLRMEPVLHKKQYSLLHMSVDEHTHVDDFHVNDVVKFPNVEVLKLLLKCGGDPNVYDIENNTPLHVIVQYNKPISDFLTLHGIIMTLLEHESHVDISNKQRKTPMDVTTTGVAEIILRTQRNIHLKCIAAKAVKRHNIPYKGYLPNTLEQFVDMH